MIKFTSFADMRDMLRKNVVINTVAVWGAESITQQSINDSFENLYVIDSPHVSFDTINYAKKIYRQADRDNLPSPFVSVGGYTDEDGKMLFPPVFEVFKDRAILLFGYTALFSMFDMLDKDEFIIPAIFVRRATMRQTYPRTREVKLKSIYFDEYRELSFDVVREEGINKEILNSELFVL